MKKTDREEKLEYTLHEACYQLLSTVERLRFIQDLLTKTTLHGSNAMATREVIESLAGKSLVEVQEILKDASEVIEFSFKDDPALALAASSDQDLRQGCRVQYEQVEERFGPGGNLKERQPKR
jgi:hypothetical protein